MSSATLTLSLLSQSPTHDIAVCCVAASIASATLGSGASAVLDISAAHIAAARRCMLTPQPNDLDGSRPQNSLHFAMRTPSQIITADNSTERGGGVLRRSP